MMQTAMTGHVLAVAGSTAAARTLALPAWGFGLLAFGVLTGLLLLVFSFVHWRG